MALTTAIDCTLIGTAAGDAITTGRSNTGVGYNALGAFDAETHNLAMGVGALGGPINGGEYNVAIGNYTLDALTSGDYNTVVGYNSGTAVTTGGNNTCMGRDSGAAIVGGNLNTCIGHDAGGAITSGSNNICIGPDAGHTGSPGGSISTGSNEIVLGDENITESHIQVDWTVASDKRDKTDVTNLDLGLEFINKLTPVTYKWDKRSKYIDKHDPSADLNAVTTDGTHKEDWLDVGFLAQDVAAIEESYDYKIANKTNLTTSLSEDGKQYSTKYNKFVPMLVKAVQELSAEVTTLKDEINTLKGE